jgi:hypothetical protein
MNNKLLIGAAAAAVGIYFLTKKKGANANTQNEKPVQGVSGINPDSRELYLEAMRLAGKIDEYSFDLISVLEISGAHKQSTIDDLEEMGRAYGSAINKEVKKMKGGRK